MTEKQRDYKKEYRDYHSKPKQIKRRGQRNAARRKMEDAGKAQPGDGKDVHHKNHDTADNEDDNLSVVSRHYNRSQNKKACLTYKANHTGAMIALFLPANVARDVALPGGEEPHELHLTLAYLGQANEISDPEWLHHAIEIFVMEHGPITGKIQGIGRFTGLEGNDAFYASFDSPDLPEFRQDLVEIIEDFSSVEINKEHGFTPHITLAYISPDDNVPVPTIEPRSVNFGAVSLVLSGKRFDYPLEGIEMETKAGARHSKSDRELTQGIHDTACELGAECKGRGDAHPMKAGARNSQTDMSRIQKIHNAASQLGAECKGAAKAYRSLPLADYGALIRMSAAIANHHKQRGEIL